MASKPRATATWLDALVAAMLDVPEGTHTLPSSVEPPRTPDEQRLVRVATSYYRDRNRDAAFTRWIDEQPASGIEPQRAYELIALAILRADTRRP